MAGVFNKPIEFLKGIGPEKAVLLNKELGIFTYADLIQHFPFRYEDRTTFHKIAMLSADLTTVQVIGKIVNFENIGTGHN